MAEQPRQQNLTALGVSFTPGVGGQVVRGTGNTSPNASSIIIGALVTDHSLGDITSLNMLVIANPLEYERIGYSNTTKLASSVIVVTAQKSLMSPSINVSLYLQLRSNSKPNYEANLTCSYYDTSTHKWNSTQCTVPRNNSNRFECRCTHLSTFALVWSRFTPFCNSQTEVTLENGTCSLKENVQV